MTLRLLTGIANAGKTGIIHARLREWITSGGRAVLLLPSPPDVARAMSELSDDCPVGLQVSTFGSYLDACWRVVGDGRSLITAPQRLLVLEEYVRTADTGCIGSSASSPGFRRMMTGLAQRAAESPLVPEGIKRRPDDPGSCLVDLVRGYFQAIEKAGLIEREQAHRIVAERIGMLDLPGLVAINRFTGLTGAQEAFISALASCSEVLISLTYSPSLPATEAAAPLVARLSRLGDVDEIEPSRQYSSSSELAAIERTFSAKPAERLTGSGSVILSEARGRASEAARIVAEIQEAVAAGIALEDMAVVLRDVVPYIPALRREFDDASIPASWDAQTPFERTGLGRAMLGLLAICDGSASRAAWMDVMRSPYTPSSAVELDRLDARVRRLTVADTEAVWLLESWLDGATAAYIRQARMACARLGDDGADESWHSLAASMLGQAYPRGCALEDEGIADAAAARTLLDAIAGFRGLPCGESPARVLSAALRGSPVSIHSDTGGRRIQIMGAERVRGRRFRCVILGGLTDGEFPRFRRDEGYGALAAEDALSRSGIDTAPRDDVASERLLFYQVITRASERLVLSRRSHDENGQPVRPSIFLEEVLDLYGDSKTAEQSHAGIPLRTIGFDTGCIGGGAPTTYRRGARSTAWTRSTGGPDGVLRWRLSDDTRRALGDLAVFSVTDIETYLQCPYRWYVERVIRPTELDVSVDASVAGQTAHEVLARVYDRFAETTGERRITPETLPDCLGLLPAVSDEVLAGVRTESAREAAEVRRAVQSVANVLKQDATFMPCFEPLYREWSFGLTNDDAPEDLDGYALRGRIDRIDCSDSQLLVTDYKLGAVGAERGAAKFAEKGLVQLPLYAHVASKRLGLETAGAVYRSITRGGVRGFVAEAVGGKPFVSTDVLTADDIESVIGAALERSRVAVEGMRSGAIEPDPRDGRCAPYCVARPFCTWRGPGDA